MKVNVRSGIADREGPRPRAAFAVFAALIAALATASASAHQVRVLLIDQDTANRRGAAILVPFSTDIRNGNGVRLKAALEARGYFVQHVGHTVIRDATPEEIKELWQDKDMIISTWASGPDPVVNGLQGRPSNVKFRDVPIPIVLTRDPIIGTTFGFFVGDYSNGDYMDTQAIDVVNPDHPLAAGLKGTVVFNQKHFIPFVRESITMGPGATIIAKNNYELGPKRLTINRVASPTPAFPHFVMWCYEKGAIMADGRPAPARRCTTIVPKPDLPGGMTDKAMQLFYAGIDWALEGRIPNTPPTVALTSPAPSAVFPVGADIALSASAQDRGGVAKVEFFQGSTLLATTLAAPHNFTWRSVPTGTYALTARATDTLGAFTISAPVTVVVNPQNNVPPTVTLSVPTNGATFTLPATIGLAATVADSDGSIVRVEFYIDGNLVSTDTAAPYAYAWNSATVGTHTAFAKAVDNGGAQRDSATVTFSVQSPVNSPPAVAFTSPASGAQIPLGDPVRVAANAFDPDGSVARVELSVDGVLFNARTAAPYEWSVPGLAAGPHAFALKAIDNLGASRTDSRSIRVDTPPSITQGPAASPSAVPVGAPATFTVAATDADNDALTYAWDFGDGTQTSFSSSVTATHAYAVPNNYLVQVTVKGGGRQTFGTLKITAFSPTAAAVPTTASTIILDAARNLVWCVNPDSNTVSCINAATNAKVLEVSVGAGPRTLALAPDGSIWVANQDAATISVLNGETGVLITAVKLPRASQPYGVAFSPNGSAAYVTLQATGQLLRLDPAARTITGSLSAVPTARGLAVSPDSKRVYVTRFLSPMTRGEIAEIDAVAFKRTRTIPLAFDNTPENDTPDDDNGSGRGVPTYLSSITITPDGRRAWVPSTKANVARGVLRDGKDLGPETTVRTILSSIDLSTGREVLADRIDINDSEGATAVCFSPLGNLTYLAVQGNNDVKVFGGPRLTNITGNLFNAGLAPQGVVLNADGSRLFTQNFMSRSISVYDTTQVLQEKTLPKLSEIKVVANELLSAQVLRGKQIFYNAADGRMSDRGYLSCAACHRDGTQDGLVWDFTGRGEGLRNTATLQGKRGVGQGRVHWSGNFDEIQDFEHDIRGGFGGAGFMTDAAFHTGTRNLPLGDRKAGVSPDLDALAAYLTSLNTVNPSPHRNTDGTLTSAGVAGRKIFQSLGCASCHSGPDFTDSSGGYLHDVGTIKASSGKRLGAALTGLDTPTLRGIWETAPYFHDGSSAALLDVLKRDTSGKHGATTSLTTTQKNQLVSYLKQIDGSEPAPPLTGLVTGLVLFNTATRTDVGPLTNGMVIDLSVVGRSLGVRADVVGTVGSVRFAVNGASLVYDSSAPFALTDDANDNGVAWFPAQGSNSLVATPYVGADGIGNIGTARTVTFTVIDPPAIVSPVTANPSAAYIGESIVLSIAVSDTNSDTLSYLWDFGDGSTSSAAEVASHAYTAAGTYIVTVTVNDGHGGIVTSRVGVTVQEAPWIGTGTGLRGEYFDNKDFTALKLTRLDPTIDFNWDAGSPAPEIGPDTFSIRWTGKVQAQHSEMYSFITSTDAGARLWINGQLVVDNWLRLTETKIGSIDLVAGVHYDIKIEFRENSGRAKARLEWSSLSTPRQVVPMRQLYPALIP